MNSKWMRGLAAMGMAIGVTFGTAGCKEEGPAEEIGEEIDEATEDAADAIEDAADDLEDKVDPNN